MWAQLQRKTAGLTENIVEKNPYFLFTHIQREYRTCRVLIYIHKDEIAAFVVFVVVTIW